MLELREHRFPEDVEAKKFEELTKIIELLLLVRGGVDQMLGEQLLV